MFDIEYEIKLFVDFLITRDNVNEIIEQYKEEIINTFNYKTILEVYNKIATANLYSKEQIDNFKSILNFVIENRTKEHDESETICLKGIVEDIINIEPSYEFYYQEFVKKFTNLDNFIDNEYQMIHKEKIELSVKYDYIVYEYLTAPFDLSKSLNLIINPNFVLSINKFLSEKPEIFKDEILKTRTINYLNYLIAYNEENKIKNDDNIEYLIYLVRKEASPLNIDIIKKYNVLLLINKIMVDNRNIDNTDYKDVITTDYFIENLNNMLLKLKNNGIGKYYGYDIKERLKYILSYILNKRNDNETKIKYNEMMSLLDKISFSKLNYFLYDEAEIKYTGFEFFKRSIVRIIFGRDMSLEEDMKLSIGRDYDALQLLFSKEDIDLNKIDPYYVRSIKKFQTDIPEIFDNDRILERAEKILTNQKVLRKR